jgi:cytochrome b subunit of formate dehydrogenase
VGALAETRKLWTAYFISNLISVAILVGGGWVFVYYLGWKPLMEHGGISAFLDLLKNMKLTSTLWWRDFLSLGFDILVVLLAIIGSWWSLGHLAAEARNQGKWRRYYKSEEAKKDVWIEKFTLWQRIQHIWVFTTFIGCAYTGFAMYLANDPYWKWFMVNRDLFVKLHVIFGWLMGALMIFHFGYYGMWILLAKLSGKRIMEEFPILQLWTWKFIKDSIKELIWVLAPVVERPKFHKYNPEQLFEYWGVYWGMLVLGIPGAFMAVYGPQVLNGVFWVTHVKEAVLAVTWIVIVHLASGHFAPTVFPMDSTFIHGKMPLKRIKEEHPLWYEQLVKKGIVKPEERKG